jgi:hypothetical protein
VADFKNWFNGKRALQRFPPQKWGANASAAPLTVVLRQLE